jgi:hypothetical protein
MSGKAVAYYKVLGLALDSPSLAQETHKKKTENWVVLRKNF